MHLTVSERECTVQYYYSTSDIEGSVLLNGKTQKNVAPRARIIMRSYEEPGDDGEMVKGEAEIDCEWWAAQRQDAANGRPWIRPSKPGSLAS